MHAEQVLLEVHDLETQLTPHTSAKTYKQGNRHIGKQEVQAMEPVLEVYWCDGHLVHDSEPRELAYSFRGQAVQLEAPAAEKKPAVQRPQDF